MNDLEIIKSNNLIEAKRNQSLTFREKKLVSYMIACIKPYDDDFKEYTFPIKDFARFFNIQDKNVIREYIKISNDIQKKTFVIEDDEQVLSTAWLAQAAYIKETKSLAFSFAPRLKPYLIQLKKFYTRYKMVNLLHFQNCHSESMYELLKQYESIGKRHLTLAQIREYLGLGKKYPLYSNFRAKVLEPTVEEINKYTDINISYQEVKKGRKVDSFKFNIWADPQNEYIKEALQRSKEDKHITKDPEPEAPKISNEIPNERQETAQRLVQFFGFTEFDAQDLIKRFDDDRINENLTLAEGKIRHLFEQGKKVVIPAYARKAIEEDYRPKESGLAQQLMQEKQQSATAQQEKKNYASQQVLKQYLDRHYQAWKKAQIDQFIEFHLSEIKEDYINALAVNNDLFSNMVYNAYKEHGFDNPQVQTHLRSYCLELHQLAERFDKDNFMKAESYRTEQSPDGYLLFKSERLIEL